METYNIVRANEGWAISQNKGKPDGSYATREGALEAAYMAASHDIKRGLGVSITVEPPRPGEPAMGQKE
jgi:hypothetical protein